MASSYFGVLLRGNWGQQLNWSSSDFTLSEMKIEDDVAESMKSKIDTSTCRSRPLEDGSWRVDGCLNVDISNQSYLPRVRSAAMRMQRSMICGAAGSIALGVARQWTNLSGRFPYFFLVSQILLGIGALLSACRFYQTQQHLDGVRKESEAFVHQVLEMRSTIYANLQHLELKCKELKIRCLHSSECPVLYRQRLTEWSKKLLEKNPQSKTGRKEWLEEFFKDDAPLHESKAELLFNQGVVSQALPHWGFFFNYEWYKEHPEKPGDYTIHRLNYIFEMARVNTQMQEELSKRYPQITEAFNRGVQGKGDKEKEILEGYRDLAYKAAAHSPAVENYYKKYQENTRLWYNLDEIYYLKVRKFLEQVSQFLEGSLKQSPKVQHGIDGVIVVPAVPQLPEVSFAPNKAFYDRARDLTPSQGTPGEYQQFLDTIGASL